MGFWTVHIYEHEIYTWLRYREADLNKAIDQVLHEVSYGVYREDHTPQREHVAFYGLEYLSDGPGKPFYSRGRDWTGIPGGNEVKICIISAERPVPGNARRPGEAYYPRFLKRLERAIRDCLPHETISHEGYPWHPNWEIGSREDEVLFQYDTDGCSAEARLIHTADQEPLLYDKWQAGLPTAIALVLERLHADSSIATQQLHRPSP